MGITKNAAFAATAVAILLSLGCDSLIGLKDFEIKSGLGDASTGVACIDPTGFGGLGCYSCPLTAQSETSTSAARLPCSSRKPAILR